MALKAPVGLFVVSLFLAPCIATATPILNGWAINVDGIIMGTREASGTLPSYASLDSTAFDSGNPAIPDYQGGSGIGELTLKLSYTAGQHTVGMWVDHAMDKDAFIYWNESGAVWNTPSAYQQYQIDEPGYYLGTIYTGFTASNLSNTNSLPAGSEDDVSMALLYRNFTLAENQTATISFVVSFTQPTSGFYLSQTGPVYLADGVTPSGTSQTLYFSSSLDIQDIGGSVPEPGTFATGFAALSVLVSRCFRQRNSA